jgi:hypothetical protein
MVLQCCIACEHHVVKLNGAKEMSHCTKENCWAKYSKCVALKALERFLNSEGVDRQRRFSALAHVYSNEE